MNLSKFEALARECQGMAKSVTARHKKHSSFELYRVLVKCMELVEACQYSERNQAELKRLFLAQEKQGNRRFVEHGSDIYILVCRFVFHKETHGANASRYSHCLREAAKMQINSARLYDHLANKGGLNALYMARPLDATQVTTKTIRLTESVTLPKVGTFTLTLKRTSENTFIPMKGQ